MMTPKWHSLTIGCALLGVLALIGSGWAGDGILTTKNDFARISRRGFEQVVNGNVDPVTGDPVLGSNSNGSRRNSDSWAIGYFNNNLFIGTDRDAGCFTDRGSPTILGTCPSTGPSGAPQLTTNQRAEIWRYAPAGVGGIAGTWTRAFQSPMTTVLFRSVPKDVGYRKATVCDVGGTNRLYVATFGVGGRILYTQDGSSFSQASTSGLNTSLQGGDLGYRPLECFTMANGQKVLMTSPVGTTTDNDLSNHPVVLVNANPANTSSPWVAISQTGIGNPNNVSLFSAANFNGWLYVGARNDTTGTEIYKTQGCTTGSLPTCATTVQWTKLIDNGAGRGGVAQDGTPLNHSLMDMKPFDADGDGTNDYLYVGIGHTASFQTAIQAELIRFNRSDDTWELVMGTPRDASASILNFNCNNLVGAQCRPLSGMGPGFGGGAPDFKDGDATYLWKMSQYDSNGDNTPEFYVGILDRGGSQQASNKRGFDLWQTLDGTHFSAIDQRGFGNSGAGGVRSLQGIAGLGLVLGTANRNTNDPNGGTEVYIGTCAHNGPLVADAGDDTVFFDNGVSPDPTAGDGKVKAALDGSRSANRYCGHPIATYEWYMGTLSSLGGICGNLSGPKYTGKTVSNIVLCTAGPSADAVNCLQHPTPSTPNPPNDYTDYPFTLKVTASDQVNPSCNEVVIRASTNRPPTAQITAPPPPALCSGNSTSGRVTLIDADGNGSQPVSLTGACSDPEGHLASCVWSAPQVDTRISGASAGVTFGSTTATSTTATVAVSRGLDIVLTATDDHSYQGTAKLTARVDTPEHDIAVQDITPTTVPAMENAQQTVTVKVANTGNFSETFNVTLVDSNGGTVSPAQQSVTLAAATPCGDATTQNVTFNWTPTVAPPTTHTLMATVPTLSGETSTSDNSLSLDVAVTAVDDLPVAVNDTATTPPNTPVTINVLANDTDEENDPIRITDFQNPSANGGTVSCQINTANGTCTYTPPTPTFTGSDTFTYTITDHPPSGPPTVTATVTVTVNAPGPPAAPTNVNDALTGTRQVTVTWTDNAVNETRYELQRCRRSFSGGCSFSNVNTNLSAVPPGTPSYIDTLSRGGTYRHRVRACNATGCSAYATSSNIQVP